MTRDQFSLSIAREPQRNSVHSELRSIDAIYYDVMDPEGWPIAGLLVLLDGRDNPVRAELYLYEGGDAHVDEIAIRQARLLLQSRYFSDEPGGGTMELRVLQTRQFSEVIQVPLQVGSEVDMGEEGWRRWWPDSWPVPGSIASLRSHPWANPMTLVMAAAALFFVVALAIAIPALLRTVGGPDTDLAVVNPDNAATAGDQTGDAAGTGASEGEAVAGDGVAVQDAGAGQQAAAFDVPLTEQTNGLSPSTNARSDLFIGQRVRIRPGLSLVLRSAPGADAGEGIGYMEDGQEALLVGGPYWTEGDTDTIVWWYVRLDDGTEAWAAANTSQLTLLEPVP